MARGKKVLFATAYIRDRSDLYNWMQSNVTYRSRLHAERTISAGLRFIKQNMPVIEILEYPTWDAYVHKLREGFDIVGFSFYLNETHELIDMIRKARDMGIPEIWGGNYGVLTKEVQSHFDRIFTGYSEIEIGEALGYEVGNIVHPPLIVPVGFSGMNLTWMGVLFTTRGCGLACRFCQTPTFANKISTLPMESIERVLAYYRKMGIGFVIILDEFFGMKSQHAKAVIELLKKYRMLWWCMTRADLIAKKYNSWNADGKLGLAGVGLGLESFNQDVLEKINKKEEAEDIIESVNFLSKKNVGVIGYYMIGFDCETRDSIKTDLENLAALKLAAAQICIIMPLPATPLWDEIEENYGIFEKDWHKFNAKHLVWNHPSISSEEMKDLLNYGLSKSNPRTGVLRRVRKIGYGAIKTTGMSGMGEILKNLYRSNVVYRSLPQPLLFGGFKS
ncbi:MAG: radical SAM protein [Thermoplasmata archaeon]|nr:MAG: radical SAM protein [Thermoplasmata archaeon]